MLGIQSTASLESHWAIKGKGNLRKLSEQNLVDCADPPSSPQGGCNGGFYTSAWYYAAASTTIYDFGQNNVASKNLPGQSLLADYPYTGTNSACAFQNVASKVGGYPTWDSTQNALFVFVNGYTKVL